MLDGFERIAITINGMLPGPPIEVYEGAEVVVHVTNNLINDGLTMHWYFILRSWFYWFCKDCSRYQMLRPPVEFWT